MFRLVAVLTAICIIAALALAEVYEVTKGPIAEQERLRVLRGFKAVLPPFNNDIEHDYKEVIVGKDKRGRDISIKFHVGKMNGKPVGTAFEVVSKEGYGGDIVILMGVDKEGKITGIEIIKHAETPGLGANITNKKWRDEFKGHSLADGPKLAVKKDGGEIDQFTGATISPRAVVKAVKWGLKMYEEKFKNG